VLACLLPLIDTYRLLEYEELCLVVNNVDKGLVCSVICTFMLGWVSFEVALQSANRAN
jgi:hypothetical protein